jgi:uncharacterized protein
VKFPCTSCGACCRSLPEGSSLNRGDGSCVHLDQQSSLCTVYDTRPLLCRIDEIYTRRFEGLVARRTYYFLQATTCASLDPRNATLPAAVAEALGEPDGALVVDPEEAKQAVARILGELSPLDDGMPHSLDTEATLQAVGQLLAAPPGDAAARKPSSAPGDVTWRSRPS